MLIAESFYEEMINATARSIRARVELYDGSTLLDTYTYDGALQSFTVERVGDSNKFFGYGICQKATIKLRDKERAINILKGQGIEVVVGVGCEYLYTCPIFFVEEIKRDENTNDLIITAYDSIYQAASHTVSEVVVPTTYTIRAFTDACAAILGMPVKMEGTNTLFDTSYPSGANYEGTETLRDALDDIAEATGTIYYMNNNWELTFKTLDINGEPVLHIDKSKYFTLTSKTNYTLQTIVSATELGDNISVTTGTDGETQYVRDNPFWNTRDDIVTLLNNTLAIVGGITINQFDCKWRGNFLLEIGDKISLTTKDDTIITTYVLNDTITYNGGLVQNTQWAYTPAQNETASNPATLGEGLKQTFAKVDKVNKRINLMVSDVAENSERISQIQMTTNGISASVSSFSDDIEKLRKEVTTKMTAEDVQIIIDSNETTEVSNVHTTTGFTFDADGLTVNKSGTEIKTTITEDGMTVYRSEEAVLIANNQGVQAEDLHATTYLIVGKNSRFEDMGTVRTACFWIGQ